MVPSVSLATKTDRRRPGGGPEGAGADRNIDLDPEDVPFQEVARVGQAVHKILDKLGAENFCKTSGKRGLHVCVPLGAQYTFAQAKLLGEIICRLVHQQLPDLTSRTPARAQRQGRIYLDQTRNVRGQSLAAPCCARPWPGATVSTPLKWSEVRSSLDPGKFTIRCRPSAPASSPARSETRCRSAPAAAPVCN
jgi:bifunctional non-homologous end joining protein LigD